MSHKCVEEVGYKSYLLPANARAPRSARVMVFTTPAFGLALRSSFISLYDYTYHWFHLFGQKRRSIEKTISEDDNMCAIDLLATVAGHLSFESGSSIDKLIEDHRVVTQKSVKEEFLEEEKPLMPEALSGENPYQGSLSPSGFSSVINGKVENEADGFSYFGGSDACQVGSFSEDIKPDIDGDALVLDARPNVVVSLGSSSRTEVPSIGNCDSHGVRDDVNLFSRDDDENFSGYIHPRVTKNSPRTVPRIGDRRIRKILASRHWKGGSRHAGSSLPKGFLSVSCLKYI